VTRISLSELRLVLGSSDGCDRTWRGGSHGRAPFDLYARHDQRAGGGSPLWGLMAPTTSQWQLRRREAGWEGSRRQSRDPRNTWRGGDRTLRVEGGAVGASLQAKAKPDAIEGPSRRRGGCARKVAGRPSLRRFQHARRGVRDLPTLSKSEPGIRPADIGGLGGRIAGETSDNAHRKSAGSQTRAHLKHRTAARVERIGCPRTIGVCQPYG
jgi:hypothetical protein